MKKIALLYDAKLEIGGVETHLLALMRHGDADRFDYVIIANVDQRFANRVKPLGIEIIPCSRWSFYNPLHIMAMVMTIKRAKGNLVHVHSPTAGALGRIAAFILGIPAIVTVHLPVTEYHGTPKTWVSKFVRQIYIRVDVLLNHAVSEKIIFVSQKVYDLAVDSSSAPRHLSVVIPNGVDWDRFQYNYAHQKFNKRDDHKIITFIGRLDVQKNIDLLLTALTMVQEHNDLARLWLIGDGPHFKELQSKAQVLGISEIVKFWGFQANVVPFLAASDIYVLPSHYEAMSISLLEAMAAGLPCIVTRAGENAALIEDGIQGFVIEDASSMAHRINQLINNPSLANAMKGAAALKAKQFSEVSMVRRVQKIYHLAFEKNDNKNSLL